ncbi:hypothetical protein ACROYT_G034448 [Oculina patagonica]
MEFQTTWKSLCFLVIFFILTWHGWQNGTSQSQDSWLRLNSRPVCFGARDDEYGSFSVPNSGKIAGFKLVHLSGYVSCDTSSVRNWCFWGCAYSYINVVITASDNHIILPLSQFFTHGGGGTWFKLPGYTTLSPEIVLPFFSPYWVNSGQEFRLWYGEDLVAHNETNNGGRVCSDVYTLYV